MEIRVDGWAWLSKEDLGSEQLEWLRSSLTVADVRSRRPVLHRAYLDADEERVIGIPRSFFRSSVTKSHNIVDCTSEGAEWPSKAPAPSGARWAKTQDDDLESLTLVDSLSGDSGGEVLSAGEREAAGEVLSFLANHMDGLALFDSEQSSAKACLFLIRVLKRKTLVVSPPGPSLSMWRTVLARYLPDAMVGYIKRGKADFAGKHIVLTTAHDLLAAVRDSMVGANEFGFVISHQIHRIDPLEWASSVGFLNPERRLGISDLRAHFNKGVSRIYSYHLGRPAYAAAGDRLIPKVRRVWSEWKLSSWIRANPQFISKQALIDQMCSNSTYNKHVVEQVLLAMKAGRKVAIFSESTAHLKSLKMSVEAEWSGSARSIDYIIDGMSPDEIQGASESDVILTTFSFAGKFPEVHGVDTVVLATPVRDPLPASNVCRFRDPDKKDPVIVDMRCDSIPVCKDYGRSRDEAYEREYGLGGGGAGD